MSSDDDLHDGQAFVMTFYLYFGYEFYSVDSIDNLDRMLVYIYYVVILAGIDFTTQNVITEFSA